MALSIFPSGQEKLYYFTGKVRAFWKDKIFFLDQKNAATVGFDNLYINGEKASQTDLHRLDAQVAGSEWESAPVLNSYVFKYDASRAPPWPYKLKGKKLWLALCAWTGAIPESIEEQIKRLNVVYMPVSYYTGKAFNMFDDKILYGDQRNSVLVHLSDLFVQGQRGDCGNAMMHFDQHTPLLHSFVVSLDFLTSRQYEGPESNFLTWPSSIDNYGSSTWIAKIAWQGEMPDECREHLSRFKIIKITEWAALCSKLGNVQRPLSNKGGHLRESFSFAASAKGKAGVKANATPKPLIATTQTEAAIVKGSLLMANHKYGLINSYLDVIVFCTKNFYVNGDLYRENVGLDDFFQDRRVPLTAWIVPLPEPVLVFDVYVMWRAVCVWHGDPPKNMETIKKRYDSGTIAGSVPEALNTSSDNRYTLVMGEVDSVTYNLGTAIAKVGKETINITFKRKAVYMNGYKLHNKCTMAEISQPLQHGIWNMLVYPVVSDIPETKVSYTALALWQFQYQQYVLTDLLYRILLEGGNASPLESIPKVESGEKSERGNMGLHMTGVIVKATPDYGIIETRSITIEPSYVFFLRSDFYIDGEGVDGNQLVHADRKRQVNLYTRSAKHQDIKKLPITMYATLVWMGKKPIPSKYTSVESPLNSASTYDVTNGSSGENLNSNSSGETPIEGTSQKIVHKMESNNPNLEHKMGWFAFLRDRYGIIRTGKLSSCTYVLFDFSILWIEGERLGSQEGLYDNIIYEEVPCNLLAYTIPVVEVGGHQVSMQASAVWLGKKPYHVALPAIKCPVKAMEAIGEQMKNKTDKLDSQKISEYVKSGKKQGATTEGSSSSNLASKLAKVSLKDNDAPPKNPSDDFMGIKIDPKNPYVGKHVAGRILKVVNEEGVAMWRCGLKEGEVYIRFARKNIHVNLCPMDENYDVNQVKICNFYVIPARHKVVEGYTTSLYATCGWIGSKPHDIPSAGDQDHSQIILDDVFAVKIKSGKVVTSYLVKLLENTGIARWRSFAHGGDVFIEFDKDKTCDTLLSFFDKDLTTEDTCRACHFFVKPIEHKQLEGHTISLTAIFGWMGKKPAHFPKFKTENQPTLFAERLHATPVEFSASERAAASDLRRDPQQQPGSGKSKGEGMSGLDNVSEIKGSPKVKEKKKKNEGIWEDDTGLYDMEGKICDLHSNVGQLKGADGSQHFFARENSYLYGVCLSNVELWHVLVQDETVMYRITEKGIGQEKVGKMWIGPEKLEAESAETHIREWCTKNLVPEGARDVLIHQLELMNDNATATQGAP